MSIKITVGNQTIDFPSSGTSPNWAQAIDDFAIAVSEQLSAIASIYDVSPRVQTLTSDANSNLILAGAVFPNGSVRSFNFYYSIYRSNTVNAYSEEGIVSGTFNTLDSTWTLQQRYQGPRQSDGTAYNTFSMSGDQLTLTTATIGGSYDSVNSTISFNARTNLVSNS